MNGDLYYPSLGTNMNQLEYLNQSGIFHQDIGNVGSYQKAFPITDNTVDLEVRIRSYLDANCSSCHRQGGVPMVDLDFRFVLPLKLQNYINFPTQSQASDPNRLVVKSGDHASSELWVRDASYNDNRMPPIGRNLVDQVYIDSLAKWIDNLSEDAGANKELFLFPNPCTDWLVLRISDNWIPPFQIKVYSIDGKFILQETSELHSVYLDLAKYPAGTYLIEAIADGERQISKFIMH